MGSRYRPASPAARRLKAEALEERRLFAGYVPLAPVPSPWATGYFTQAGTLDLQAGAAAAPDVAAGEAASPPRAVPINANGLPLLNSRAGGAGTELFIDFSRNADGRGTFSLDADRENFNFVEQKAIFDCWREIVGFFSQFNLNVTTVLPPTGPSDPVFSWIQITNEFPGGAAYVNWLSKDGPKGTVNSGDAVGRVSGIIHEYGHNLGLNHQGEFDKYGNKTAEYSDGYSYRDRPIMGIDYLGAIRKMTVGRTVAAGDVQDDVAVIAATAAWSNGAGGDGFRPDDFGNTPATAFTLAPGSQQLDAFTERYNDADVFKVTPTTAGPWNFTATPLYLSQAEPKLELLDASGNVIAARDDADVRNGPTNEQLLNVNLTPGTYYVRVTSGGDYAELGYYKLGATQLPAGFVSNDVGVPAVSGSVTYDPGSGVFTQSGGGGDIWNQSDQFRYTYATLTGNGSITARVDGLDNIGTYTKAGVMVRQSLAANSAHAFLGIKPDGGIDSIWRSATGANSANVNNAAVGPWVRISRSGNVFTYQRSADGTNWTTLGTTTIGMSGPVLIGLANTAWADSRYESFATFSNVAVTGNITPAGPTYNVLPAPTGLTAAPAPGVNTSVSLNWTAVAGATGYVVEHSINGVDFGVAGSVTGTSHTHVNPAGSMRQFYRVSAANGTALNSTPSAVASVVNKPGAPALTPGGFTPSAMAIGTTEVFLTWLDSSGETGYRIEQSTDGVNFVTRYTNPANHTVSNLNNLTPGTAYTFRITPLTSVGDGQAQPLLINTQTRMAAVANLRFTAKTPTSMSIAWNDAGLESGYRVERSLNGVDWTFMGDTAQNVTTWTDNNVTAGNEYYYRVMPWNPSFDGVMSNAIFAAAPAASLPAGWNNADVGAVAGTGAAVSTGAGAWKAVSGGGDVFNNADAFNFTYRAVTGDATIVARIDGVEGTDNAAKAGLMFRQDLTPGSKSVAVMLNAGGGFGIDLRTRATAGAGTGYQQLQGGVAAPYWLKLSRSGNTITASVSTDGVTFTRSTSVVVPLAGTFYVGLAVNAFSTTQLNTSTFSNVGVTEALPAWLAPGSAATWNPATKALAVTGAATIIADPGADAPVITANGTAAALTIAPASSTLLTLGGLTLSGGASAAVSSAGAARTLTVDGARFGIDGSSRLDLGDNALVLRNAGQAAAQALHAGVNGLVRTGFNDFAWNGAGISSSTAAADIAGGVPSTLGILLNNDGAGGPLFYGAGTDQPTFLGATVDSNTVMLRFTRLGDGDLNGVVDSVDFALFQAGYTGTPPYVGFAFGDYDFNGVIDSVDFGLFQAGYQSPAAADGMASPDDEDELTSIETLLTN